MRIRGTVCALFIAGTVMSASSAYAGIVLTGTTGTTTSEAGAGTFENFDGTSLPGIGSVSGGQLNLGTNPGAGVNFLSTSSGVPNIAVTFTSLVDYFGFLWGSQDNYNFVELFRGSASLGVFSGNSLPSGTFINFFATTAADNFDRAVLSSTACCFEVDNLAARLAPTSSNQVAEPATLGLLGLGLAGLGFARRRNSRACQRKAI